MNRPNKEFNIYIGCDSQNHHKTRYATTIILHTPNGGSHIIFREECYPLIMDITTRLWAEVQKSIEVANYLKENGINVTAIDLDYNTKPECQSSNIVKSAIGFVQGMGFGVRCKPDPLPAVYAADHIVN